MITDRSGPNGADAGRRTTVDPFGAARVPLSGPRADSRLKRLPAHRKPLCRHGKLSGYGKHQVNARMCKLQNWSEWRPGSTRTALRVINSSAADTLPGRAVPAYGLDRTRER